MSIINDLSRYDRLIVSGCQRSGTTAISKMLASDLGYTLIDESEFNFHDSEKFLHELRRQRFVIQCPALSHLLHLIHAPSAILIWMRRPFHEIRNSMQRLKWWIPVEEPREKSKYKGMFENCYEYDPTLPIEQIKFEVWADYQKPRMQIPYLELDYDCPYMLEHRLYVNAAERSEFKAKQTTANQRNAPPHMPHNHGDTKFCQ